MALDKELQGLVDQARAAIEQGATLRSQVEAMMAWGADKGRLANIESAVRQLETDLRSIPKDIETKLAQVRRAAWDNNGNYRGIFASEEQARGFGLICLGLDPDRRSFARDEFKRSFDGIFQRDMASNPDSLGGGLIPIEFSTRIKRLVETFGVADAEAFHMPMSTDQMAFNKQTGEVIVYLVGEGKAPTESDLGFSLVNLIAKEWGTLTFYPQNLADDAIAVIGELVARSIAWAYASVTDDCVFNGDGTSVTDGSKPNYLGIVGITQKLITANTVGGGAGLIQASGNSWAGVTLTDHLNMMGALPEYADNAGDANSGAGLMGVGAPTSKIYCSRNYFFNTLVKQILSEGGVTAAEIQGRRQLVFGGAPVRITQKMARSSLTATVPVLYGDMSMAVTIGDRLQMRIEQSREYKFAERQITVRGTVRKAVNVDSVGTATVAGPMVGLVLQ